MLNFCDISYSIRLFVRRANISIFFVPFLYNKFEESSTSFIMLHWVGKTGVPKFSHTFFGLLSITSKKAVVQISNFSGPDDLRNELHATDTRHNYKIN